MASYELMQISDDDSWVKCFEKKLQSVDRLALAKNVIHSLNGLISTCEHAIALIIIVITAVSTSTQPHLSIKPNCYSVVALTLLEIVRRSVARFVAFFVLQKITIATTDPRFLTYSDSTRQTLISLSRKLNSGIQISLLTVSIVLSINGLCAENPKISDANLLLRMFYKISLSNAILATVAMSFLEFLMFPLVVTSHGLRKYYDTRVWMSMDKGLLRACSDSVDILSFCFDVQADEYRRNQRAPVVMDLYGDLMRYLYCDARFKGFEKAAQLLEFGDPYQREAAANIVGCWMRLMEQNCSTKSKTLLVQQRLLSKLADALDHEETGRAATSSFEALAKKDAKFTAMVKNQKGEKLADILIDRIHEVVEMGKSDKAIVFIKVWIQLLPVVLSLDHTENTNSYEGKMISKGAASWWQAVTENMNDQSVSKYCTIKKFRVLQQDLVKIVSDVGALKRTQAIAAYALLISDDPILETVLPSLREHLLLPPRRTEHILTEERDYALSVLNLNYTSGSKYAAGDVALPVQWNGKVKHRSISALQKAANKSTWIRVGAWASPYVASLVTIAVPLICSVYFTNCYIAHFQQKET